MKSETQIRTYQRAECAVFSKTKEGFGGLSNMAGGFPLRVNGMRILTSEALYQACRFPHLPNVQRLIIQQHSPMTAKMKSKPHRGDSRPDWDRVRVKVMRWCLRVKLAQNWRAFSALLLATGEQPIVEESRKDDFWGAKPVDECTLVGMNVLGRLLMELRESIKAESRDSLMQVEPIVIPDFLLGDQPIGIVTVQGEEVAVTPVQPVQHPSRGYVGSRELAQPPLFDASMVKEAVPPMYLYPDVSAKVVGITDLKSYPEYKESGMPWLGQVPGHWALIPNRGLVRRRKVLVGKRHSEYRLLSLTKRGVIVRDVSTGKGKFSADMGTSQEVRNGDLVFCLFDVPETPRTVGLSRHDGMITGAYTVLECPRSGIAEYFERFYLAMDDRKLLSPMYSGLRNTIPAERFLGTKTPQPPLAEQAAIVQLLDWANGRLERTIRAKRRVIALLNEQKQAIIHRAVTRGLDPSVSLKPSGIPWLGDIPQHWEVRRLRHACEMRVSNVDKHSKEGESPVRLCNYVEVYKNERIRESTRFMAATASEDERIRFGLRKGDVLITKDSEQWNDIGVPALVECEAPDLVCGYHLAILRSRPSLHGTFLHRALQSRFIATQFHVEANGVTRYGLSHGAIQGVAITLPPLAEQQAIVVFLDRETGRLDTTISRLEREIELLREYRTRLVADVVTGKLDVREAAARLPELEPESGAELDSVEADETGEDLTEVDA